MTTTERVSISNWFLQDKNTEVGPTGPAQFCAPKVGEYGWFEEKDWRVTLARLRSSSSPSADQTSPLNNNLARAWLNLSACNLAVPWIYSFDQTSRVVDESARVSIAYLANSFNLVSNIYRADQSRVITVVGPNPEEEYFKIHTPEKGASGRIMTSTLLSSEIVQFCFKHQLTSNLWPVINIIEASFGMLTETKLTIEKDPETDEEWLAFNIIVRDSIKRVLADYDSCTDRLIAEIPWSFRQWLRLSFNIEG